MYLDVDILSVSAGPFTSAVKTCSVNIANVSLSYKQNANCTVRFTYKMFECIQQSGVIKGSDCDVVV